MQKKENRKWINLIIVIVAILAIGAWRFGSELTKLEIQREQARLEKVAVSEAKYVNEKLKNQINTLDNISKLVVEDGLDNPKQEIKTIQKVVEKNAFERIGIVDLDGNAITTNGLNKNVSMRNFFKETIQGKALVSEVVEIRGTEEKSVIISTPIKESGKVQGVVYGVMDLNEMRREFGSQWNQDMQYIQVIDSSGNYVLKSSDTQHFADGENIYEDLMEYEFQGDMTLDKLRDRINHHQSGSFSYDYNESKQYVHILPLDVCGWSILSITPSEIIETNIDALGIIVFELVAKVFLCFVIILIFVVRMYQKTNQTIVASNHQLKEFSKILSIMLEKSKDNVFEYFPQTSIFKIYHKTNNEGDSAFEEISLFDLIESSMIAPEFTEVFRNYISNDIMQEHSELILKLKIDGENYNWMKITTTGIYQDKKIVNVIGFIRDCSKEKEMELLYEQEKKYRSILVDNAIFSCEVDLQNDHVLSRDEFVCSDYDIKYSESVVETVRQRVHPSYKEDVLRYTSIQYLMTMFHKGQEQLKYEFMRKNDSGTYIWIEMIARVYENENGHIIALIVLNDINEQKEKEIELSYKAQYDYLTTLYNRETLVSKIDEYLSYPSSRDQLNALLLLDLDNFKEVNDTLGHDVGDKALKDVSNILKGKFRTGDLIGRLGGDEFVVFCKDINDARFVERVSKELCELLELTYTKEDKVVVMTSSIGIATAPKNGRTFNELYVKADEALYDVKRGLKNGYKIYEED